MLPMSLIRLIALCTILIPFSNNSTVYCDEPAKLPSWFWDTPMHPNAHFAVGYSRPHRDSPTAFNDAFADASYRRFGDINGVRIVGETAAVSTPHGTRLFYNTMEIVLDTAGLADFRHSLFRLDSVSTPDLRAILVANSDLRINNALIKPPPTADIEFLQAGIEQGFYHFSSSWIGAERQARIEHCVGQRSNFKSLSKSWNEILESSAVSSVDEFISGLQTFSRRYDAERNIFVVQVIEK